MSSFIDSTNFYGSKTLTQTLRENLVGMLRYGLLEIGAYYNITLGLTNQHGDDLSRYRPVSYPGTTGIRVFQGFKADAVWESGITVQSTGISQPIAITGIVVNNTFAATGSTVLGTTYYLDYPNNRVVFAAPVPSGTKVQVPHSVRAVSVYDTVGDVYRKLVSDWVAQPSGTSASTDYSIEEKAYLPAVFVRIDGYSDSVGHELGSRTKRSKANITIDTISTNDFDGERLLDICYGLETRTMRLFDVDTVPKPLDYRGALKPDAITYPAMISGYAEPGIVRFNEDARGRLIMTNLPYNVYRTTISLEVTIAPV
jgi:hypothetical protein